MMVDVADEAASRISEHPGSIVLEITASSGPDAVFDALEEAAAEVRTLDGPLIADAYRRDGPASVLLVLRTLTGGVIVVDGGSVATSVLLTIPDIVGRSLERHRIEDARIDALDPLGPLYHQGPLLPQTPRAAILRLYARDAPGHEELRADMPPHWLQETIDWVSELPPRLVDESLTLLVTRAQLSVSRQGALYVAEQCRQLGRQSVAHASVSLIVGQLDERLRAARASFSGRQRCSMGGGGPAATHGELLQTFESLTSLALRLSSDVAYAYVTFRALVPAGRKLCRYRSFLARRYQADGGGTTRQ